MIRQLLDWFVTYAQASYLSGTWDWEAAGWRVHHALLWLDRPR